MLDKYGVGQDPYCYPDSSVLRNRLDLREARKATPCFAPRNAFRLKR